MEKLNEIWAMIMPYFTVTSIGAVLSAVMLALIKGFISKKFSKVNMQALYDASFEKSQDKIKEVVFKHDIAPLVNAKLAEIEENTTQQVGKEMNDVKAIIENQTKLLGLFMSYFDNSIGIPQEVREEAKRQYNATMGLCESREPQPVESKVVIEDKPKHEDKVIVER